MSSSGNQNRGRSRSSAKAEDGAVARATVRARLFMKDLLPRKLVGILVLSRVAHLLEVNGILFKLQTRFYLLHLCPFTSGECD